MFERDWKKTGEKVKIDGTRRKQKKKNSVSKTENRKLRTWVGVELTALTLAHIRWKAAHFRADTMSCRRKVSKCITPCFPWRWSLSNISMGYHIITDLLLELSGLHPALQNLETGFKQLQACQILCTGNRHTLTVLCCCNGHPGNTHSPAQGCNPFQGSGCTVFVVIICSTLGTHKKKNLLLVLLQNETKTIATSLKQKIQ